MKIGSQNPEILAREFWSGTGLEHVFPRDLERAIVMKLPLPLVKLPVLTMQTVATWLTKKRLAVAFPPRQHDLLGCLVAHRGHGFLFVCATDSMDEQRLTLAHEVAHFLMDYLWPRQQTIRMLGESIAEVLDGMRKATPAERAIAALSRIRVGAHVHLLPRRGVDGDADAVIARIEARADRLALELVAPRERIASLLRALPAREAVSCHEAGAALAVRFGLPAYAFASVVRLGNAPRPLSFLEAVRAALRK